MPEPITRQDLADLGDRIERRFNERFDKVDQRFDHLEGRFDRFEVHFDETMTAIRATLDEIHDQVTEEHRREVARIEEALLVLARETGHLDQVAVALHQV